MFIVDLSMKEIRTPVALLLLVSSASVKFVESARLIGMIELTVGMKMPTKSALKTALSDGMTDGKYPSESRNRILQRQYMRGNDSTKPKMTAGRTNMTA